MKTNERKICAYCRYYWPAEGYYDEMSRCTNKNIPVQSDCTCNWFEYKTNFYTDINDYDEQGNTNNDSSEFNFD